MKSDFTNPNIRFEDTQIGRLIQRRSALGQRAPDLVTAFNNPDLVLRFGKRLIGVEVAETVLEIEKSASNLHHEICQTDWTSTRKLVDRRSGHMTKDRTTTEMRESFARIPVDEVEQGMMDWRNRFAIALAASRARLNGPGFSRFDQNWLCLVDQTRPPNFGTNRLQALRFFKTVLWQPCHVQFDFDAVFVLSGEYFFSGCANVITLTCDSRPSDRCADASTTPGGLNRFG